jgi:hypothetical protein
MLSKITIESVSIIRANNDNLCVAIYESCVIAAQLRHVPTAERSHKAAIEN